MSAWWWLAAAEQPTEDCCGTDDPEFCGHLECPASALRRLADEAAQ